MTIRSLQVSIMQWGGIILSPLLSLFFLGPALSAGRDRNLVNTSSMVIPFDSMRLSQLLNPESPQYWLYDRGFSIEHLGPRNNDFRIMNDQLLESPMIVTVTERSEGRYIRMRTVNEDQSPIGAFSESLSYYEFEDLGDKSRLTSTETSVFAEDMGVYGRAYHHFMMWLSVKLDLLRIADQAAKKF